jgi:hypothetical protein
MVKGKSYYIKCLSRVGPRPYRPAGSGSTWATAFGRSSPRRRKPLNRQQKAEKRALQRRIEPDTCGLGRWEQPEGWDYPTYSHTVTMVDGNTDHWLPYITGATVVFAVHPAEEPFVRGAAYVWCKRAWENGGVWFPTSPLFGRFIEQAGSRPKVSRGQGPGCSSGRGICLLLPRGGESTRSRKRSAASIGRSPPVPMNSRTVQLYFGFALRDSPLWARGLAV